MPKPSSHDLVVDKIRDDARQELIDHYTRVAAETSEEYGFLNVRGQEVPDPTVMEPPLGYIQQPDLMEQMRRMITTHLSDIAAANEMESFEEADDFDIDDDPVDYQSPYEEFFDPPPGAPPGPPGELRPAPNAPAEPQAAPAVRGGGGAEPPSDKQNGGV